MKTENYRFVLYPALDGYPSFILEDLKTDKTREFDTEQEAKEFIEFLEFKEGKDEDRDTTSY